jgi:tRNA pseudouridine55 synthase
MFGLVNVDKPYDVTSRDVVNHVQRMVRPNKVGHAGTLDPLATGVLVVCVGQATRLNEFVQHLEKKYTGTFLLGRQSETEDTEGEVVEVAGAPRPSAEEVEQVLQRFRGEIMQRPPTFSALKVKGRRAYALARRGKEVKLDPRPVTIHELELVRYQYPELVLDVTCSSGTYIRSLGRDIGEALGSAAVMSGLRRTAIGPFTIDKACPLDELSRSTLDAHLLPASMAVAHFPSMTVGSHEIEELSHGRFIAGSVPPNAKLLAALDDQGNLIALLEAAPKSGLKPHRFFAQRDR